jgi:hypothetical protein
VPQKCGRHGGGISSLNSFWGLHPAEGTRVTDPYYLIDEVWKAVVDSLLGLSLKEVKAL